MKTKIIELETQDRTLWGKFMVGIFDEEWSRPSAVYPRSRCLLLSLGWGPNHFLVVDLSVGHGAIFHLRGYVREDLAEKGIYF